MAKAESPFLIVNPKSYLYGEKSLELAKAADKTAKETGLQIYFTCPYADIRLIKENTENLIVCAQSMDSLTPGRGMGHVLPESLKEAGAEAVFLNHAENQKTVSELYATIKRAKELGMITIVCADSTVEAKAVACMDPDIVLAEPTDLIGTGKVADDSYTIETVKGLHEVNPDVLVMIASGVSTAEDCYNAVSYTHLEDEVMFLVLYFASVIEKEKIQSNKNKKIPVALVCATGRGTVQFMLAKLKILENIIDIVSVSSHHNMNEIEQSGARMIISTIPLPNSKLPNVAVRSPMLDDQDILTIQQKVFELKEKEQEEIEEQENRVIKQNPQKDIQGAFYNLLSKERIEMDYPAKDWEDAIRCAGKLLYDTNTVTEQYVEEMVSSVKKHGPYIVVCKGMALPHADCSKGAIKEAASLVRLKTPIEFGSVYNDPVRYVIGMSIKSAESINQAIYDMMKIFGDENNMNKFDSLPDEQAVLDMINSFQKQKI